MLLIWGWRTYVHQLLMLTLVCSRCQNPAAHNLYKRVTKFTLFFIPLFPISRKYGLQCAFCGVAYDIDKAHAEQLMASVQQQPQPLQGQPVQGQPSPGQPVQGQPVQGQPVQGQPVQGQPFPGQPHQH